MIACITPTRSREQQLSLVIDCINRQTVQPDMWIIVDDGKYPVSKLIIDKIRCPHQYIYWQSHLSASTCANTAKALLAVTADVYVCIDDDDYYPDTYIEHIVSLCRYDNLLVGNGIWPDYRLSTGYYRVRLKMLGQVCKSTGDTMAEWHQTAIKGLKLKADIIAVCKRYPTERYNDCRVYKELIQSGKYICRLYDFGEHSCISLKDFGVGNPGLIESHRTNLNLTEDKDNLWFKEHVTHWTAYRKYLNRGKQKPLRLLSICAAVTTYGLPYMIELQLYYLTVVNRIHVLVIDDHSPDSLAIKALCDKYNAEFICNEHRHGHSRGDLRGFALGLQWAHRNNYQYMIKISQSYVVMMLFVSYILDKIAASDPVTMCGYLEQGFTFRSLFAVMKVDAWKLKIQEFLQISPPFEKSFHDGITNGQLVLNYLFQVSKELKLKYGSEKFKSYLKLQDVRSDIDCYVDLPRLFGLSRRHLPAGIVSRHTADQKFYEDAQKEIQLHMKKG